MRKPNCPNKTTASHVYITGPAFQPTMQAVDNHERDLIDEVAKIAFEKLLDGSQAQIRNDISMGIPVEQIAAATAKLSYDFVDAFMRERYERECVARTMVQPNFGKYPGNYIS